METLRTNGATLTSAWTKRRVISSECSASRSFCRDQVNTGSGYVLSWFLGCSRRQVWGIIGSCTGRLSPQESSMTADGHFRVPTPVNEPVRSYAPGDHHRKTLKARLA